MSHYDTLGVPTDASADDIKAAFRRKASEHHPDKGGAADLMAAVNRAYEVLGDQQRREQYDATGDDAEVDRNQQVANIVMSAFAQILANGSEHGVLQQTKDFLRSRAAALKTDTAKHERNVAKLQRQRDKVKRKEGVNLYHGLIDNQLSNLDDLIRETDKAIGLLTDALAALDAYEANEQPIVPPDGTASSSIAELFNRAAWRLYADPFHGGTK